MQSFAAITKSHMVRAELSETKNVLKIEACTKSLDEFWSVEINLPSVSYGDEQEVVFVKPDQVYHMLDQSLHLRDESYVVSFSNTEIVGVGPLLVIKIKNTLVGKDMEILLGKM